MRAKLDLLLGAMLLAGCAATDDATGISNGYETIDRYDREVSFPAPMPCSAWLHLRRVDELARTVEYGARVGERELALVYAVRAGDELPLAAEVYDQSGALLLGVRADERRVELYDRAGAALRVDGYATPAALASELDAGRAAALLGDSEALALVRCGLTVRPELGAMPAFLRNLASGGLVPGADGVVQHSSDAPPILDWQAPHTLLGTHVLFAACLQPHGWACPCLRMHGGPEGPVDGWCE